MKKDIQGLLMIHKNDLNLWTVHNFFKKLVACSFFVHAYYKHVVAVNIVYIVNML